LGSRQRGKHRAGHGTFPLTPPKAINQAYISANVWGMCFHFTVGNSLLVGNGIA